MPAALGPTRITLPRKYPIDESLAERADDWAAPLWQYIRTKIPFKVDFSVLRSTELEKVMHERFVNYVYSRLVIGTCHALKKAESEGADDDRRTELLAEAVDAVLDIDPIERDRVVWLLDRLGKRIRGKQANPSQGQRNAIVRMAVEHGHRCYLCGRTLHYASRPLGDDDAPGIVRRREKSAFEIEHVWSQAQGGSRSRANLAASCNECNKLKRHLISFADFAIEQIMTTATSPDSIRAAINGDARFALMWKQSGCCAVCERYFYDVDSESLFLVKREANEPYHFFNMMAVCNDCNTTHRLDGVDLRA